MAAPLPEAIRRISDKTPIGSVLRSAEWAGVPLALRERAFFSAGVESARFLSTAQEKLRKAISLEKEKVARGEAFVDRSSFIADMRKIAIEEGIFVDPLKKGGLQDITSRKRLGLIFDFQDQQAKDFARWKVDQDPDVLDAFPAQELVRLESRLLPRGGMPDSRAIGQYWRRRWAELGGKFFDGRMIALKNWDGWRKLSQFGTPWLPLAFGSGMGFEDVDRDEAESLGLIEPGETLVPEEAGFNDALSASVRGLSPEYQAALKTLFKDQIEIDGEEIHWKGQKPLPVRAPEPKPPVVEPRVGPAGIPVSEAMQFGFTKKETPRYEALKRKIDAVHGDGALSPIPINHKVSPRSRGTYYSNSRGAVSIGVRRNAEEGEFAMAHEIGHWLDHVGIPSGTRFASASGLPLFADFNKAVRESQAWRDLGKIANPRYRSYAQSPEEVWARAYCQFIAVRSGDRGILDFLEKIKAGQTGYYSSLQWTAEDFAPIEAAIEGMFRKLGWMK